jgi:hypothetical protein
VVLASGWVQPMNCSGKKIQGQKRMRSGCLGPWWPPREVALNWITARQPGGRIITGGGVGEWGGVCVQELDKFRFAEVKARA